MKKSVRTYIIIWATLVALFNVVAFVTPSKVNGVSKYTSSFWIGYLFIMLAFVAHFAFVYFSLSTNSKEKIILNIPLIMISIVEFGAMFFAGLLCMVIQPLPYWVGVILCCTILALSIIITVTAKGVGENNSDANITLNERTNNYRNMVDAASIMLKRASSSEQKDVAQKVYDEIRSSDAISYESTYQDEISIINYVNELAVGLANNDSLDSLKQIANEVEVLVEQRNNKCKAEKRKV